MTTRDRGTLSSNALAISAPPERAYLVNEDFEFEESSLPRALAFFINPEALQYEAAASWAKIAVPGLSHEVLQWSHNPSRQVSFTLQWSLLEDRRRRVTTDDDGTGPGVDFAVYQDFIAALILPMERGRAPSRVSLVWPNFMDITGVVLSTNFKFNRFARTGEPMAFDVDLTLLELRTVFMQRRGNNVPLRSGDLSVEGSLARFYQSQRGDR